MDWYPSWHTANFIYNSCKITKLGKDFFQLLKLILLQVCLKVSQFCFSNSKHRLICVLVLVLGCECLFVVEGPHPASKCRAGMGVLFIDVVFFNVSCEFFQMHIHSTTLLLYVSKLPFSYLIVINSCVKFQLLSV